MALSEPSKEMEWLIGFFDEMGIRQERAILYNDSQSAMHLAKNHM